MKEESAIRVLISRIIGIVLFLIILYLGNMFIPRFDNHIANSIIEFFNNNLSLIIVMSIIFLVSEVFQTFALPLSLIYPVFSAMGSIYLIKFLFRALLLVDDIIGRVIFAPLHNFSEIAYPIVFLIFLIGGYINIISKLGKKERKKQEKEDIKDMIKELKDSMEEGIKDIRKAVGIDKEKRKRKKRK